MQPCKTGDQLYSDASPYSECSLGKSSPTPGADTAHWILSCGLSSNPKQNINDFCDLPI